MELYRTTDRRRNGLNVLAMTMMAGAVMLAVLPALALLGYVARRGGVALRWSFITGLPAPGLTGGGIGPAVLGTAALIGITLAVAVPLGLGTAIYLQEYTRRRFLAPITMGAAALAGVPSVVYGLFGLALFGLGLGLGPSLLTGGLTLGLITLPPIVMATCTALAAVPHPWREASVALGAGRWQTIRHVVLPAAAPAIVSGIILAVGRAAGEAAPLLFAAAALYMPHLPKTVFDRVMTLPTHLYAVAVQVPGVPAERQYSAALVLLLLILGMYLSAHLLKFYWRGGRY